MTSASDDDQTVIYEVNLEADAAIADAFDTWLRDHVADMLQLEGFLSAEILVDATPPAGRIRRTTQYRLRDQAALDRYLRDDAARMRGHGLALFGDRFAAERRTLMRREEFIRGAVSTENCLNCGEVLTGQHCSHCGQRAKVRVLSLRSLLRDLIGDLTEWDSRVWRTLRPLAFKPGHLTSEYLRGRRTLYTPPFRMYLILSVAFFLLTTLGADPGGAMVFDVGEDGANLQLRNGSDEGAAQPEGSAAPAAATAPSTATTSTPNRTSTPVATSARTSTPTTEPTTTPTTTPKSAPTSAPTPPTKLDPTRQRVIDRILERVPAGPARERARADLEQEFGALTPEQVAPVERLINDPCGESGFQVDIGPWGERYEPRLRDACRKIVADSQSFGRALYENIPKMMFIFLPMIAAVMFVLYLGSGRYYVEHLLFFVHYHAFFFLGGIVIVLLDRGAALSDGTGLATALRAAEGLLTTVFFFYVPFYLYRAMRRVYGQRHLVTLLKYSLLGVGYVFFMALTAVGLLAYTALTL